MAIKRPAKPVTEVRAKHLSSTGRDDPIRLFHGLGTRVRERAARDKKPMDSAARELADEEGVSYDRARKAARFASLCSENELAQICKLPMKSGKAPLSVNHVRQVLKFRRSVERLKWLRRAAEEDLSAADLEKAIGRSDAARAGLGGPKLRKPDDLLHALEQVIDRSDDWLKRHQQLWGDDACWPPMIGYGNSEPAKLAEQLDLAVGRLADLGEAAKALGERIGKLKPDVKKRKSSPKGLDKKPGGGSPKG
jgi:hypothetical protein